MDLPFNKLIVDSRFANSGTSTDFEISLPETLSLSHNAVAYVCGVQVTHTFATTDDNSNTLYFIERATLSDGTTQDSLNRAVVDTTKVYSAVSLQQELQNKIKRCFYVW